jgi:predicted outer membrane repeat protein
MENKKNAYFQTSLNNFTGNSARNKGGAIYYDLLSPFMLMSN